MSKATNETTARRDLMRAASFQGRMLARAIRCGETLLALVATCAAVGCSDAASSADGDVRAGSAALTLTFGTSSTYALTSAAIPTTNVTNGSGPYTCSISSNTSGGAGCSVSGTTVSYTAGSYGGYYLKSERTSDYLRLVTAAGGPYLEAGGTLGSTAELFKFTPSGSGFKFQAKSTGNYLRAAGTVSPGNDLVADTASGDVFTMQNCNGTAYPTVFNRFGFASATGSSPYWKENPSPYVETVNNGTGNACSPTTTAQFQAFYFVPNTDTLTITDASANTGSISVTVEIPLAFMPASSNAVVSSAMGAVQTYGGSGVFTGGSSACTVTINASGSSSGCSVSASGVVTYTAGAATGSDAIRITDSQGHTGTLSVLVTQALSLSSSTSYALAGSSLGTSTTVSGGVTPYSCSITSNSSSGSSCSVVGNTVTYTSGENAGFYLQSQSTADYLRSVAGAGGPYVQTGGAIGSSAELWNIVPLGSGYTFQSLASGLYVRNGGTNSAGNDLIVDTTQANAATYAIQNCNGTGDPGQYNRFGFSSATGSSPYWKARSPYVDAVNNGNAATCSTSSSTAPEAFYLTPGQDTLTITDSAAHSLPITVTVEAPITFRPASFNVAASTAITSQALGGSGVFTGGSSSCAVTTNTTGGGACTVTGYGSLSYTPGSSSGTDTITVTDSQGHTGKLAVSVNISVTQVAVSHNYFWCARASDGTARCAGYNADGELGNGSISSYSATPVAVAGVSSVSSVAAGELHACALLTNGTIRCWGDNSYGQLGNGTTTSSPSAVTVSGISDATAISAGMVHTCALRSGGTVVCWGQNASGQTGNSGASAWPLATTPAAVTGLAGVSAIASGGFHSCALTSGGAVKCWGDNSAYQLGDGNGGPTQRSFAPVTPTGLGSGVSSIASGEQHSCAVISGAVKCWGDNTYGQLGNNSTTSASTPVSVSSLTTTADLALAYVSSCARQTDKTVKCWGRNTEGELGDGTSLDSLVPTTVTGISTAASISAGGVNGCAALSSGLLLCWGYGVYGQLGNTAVADSHVPVSTALTCASCGSPDMTVSAVTWSPSNLTTTDTTTFSATIFNQGVGATPAGVINGVAFYVDGTKVNWSWNNSTSIAPGSSVTVTASAGTNGSTWTVTPGPHTIQALVDDQNRYTESDETNNTLNATMTVTPRYSFESSTQSWASSGNVTSLAQSAIQAYSGTSSLQVNLSGTNGNGYAQVAPGAAAPGQGTVVTYRVWVPTGSGLTAVQPFVQEGSGSFTFTGNYKVVSGLSQGNWNTLTVTVPSNAAPITKVGVQFVLNGTVTTTAYVDAIDW